MEKSRKYIYKSYLLLLLDSGKCVQKVLKHGTTKFYNCRIMRQGDLDHLAPL